MIVDKAIKERELADEVMFLRSEVMERTCEFKEIVGHSRSICKLLETVTNAAKTSSNVLITGESGTGKELVARAIHSKSTNRSRPFITVSCPNLPLNLFESELFGHEKGAFTGATERKIGKFEMVSKGTIFLDEIAETPLALQSKFLRVIQEREFYRVGGLKPVKVDCRIITATNKNLNVEMENGNFRKDLYYRLNVIPVVTSPLRERKDDIPLLTSHFITMLKKVIHCKTIKCSTKATEILKNYDWPGNIRELRNIIERVLSLCGDTETITPHCLPEEITRNHIYKKNLKFELSSIESLSSVISNVEKDLISQAYQRSGGKLLAAAKLLNITPRILRYKIGKLGVEKVNEEGVVLT
ncbi:MAG: sigma-54 interaction domain-containing protein [Candidatus Anammoxibacter sp.]